MKQSKSILWALFALALLSPGLYAQSDSGRGIGLAVKASTNGGGADVTWQFHQKWGVRFGFETMKFQSGFTFEEEAVMYDAELRVKTGSLSLLANYNLGKRIYLTAGAGYNLFHADVDGQAADYLQFGDIQIPKEDIGTFSLDVDPTWKISPYAGIGFGRILGLEKRLGFAAEVGAFYQGPPEISILADGLLSPTANPDQKQDVKLEKQVSQYSVYPVVKLTLSYKIVRL